MSLFSESDQSVTMSDKSYIDQAKAAASAAGSCFFLAFWQALVLTLAFCHGSPYMTRAAVLQVES